MHHGSDGAVDPYLKRTFLILIFVESIITAGDVTIVTLWYTELYLLRLELSPFLALQLMVEFIVLTCLTTMSKGRIELRHSRSVLLARRLRLLRW